MYKPQSQRWRMFLFLLALVLVASVPLFSARAASTDEVTITTFPKDYQLYPRNGSNQGTVTVAGSIISSSTSQVRVDVLRNGVAYGSQSQNLSYNAGSADFSVDVTIDAELANYTIKLFTVDGGVDALQATANNVVAGDVFVIQGQSNAVAGMYTNDDDGNAANDPAIMTSLDARSEFVRTYSSSTGDVSVLSLDQNWYVADGDGFNGAGTIGQWGLKMGDTLVENHGVPLAIINGAFGGEEISFFQRNDADPDDLSTNYGRLLFRLEESGLKDSIKGLFWYQGESDEGDVELHLAGFDSIYSDWKFDYPSIQDVYVFQVGDFCFNDNIGLREAQRRLPETYGDVTVISTNAIKGHRKDCHYWWQDGYETLGERAALLVGRDHYGAQDVAVDSPDLKRAYFSNAARTEITLELENVADGFSFDASAVYRFAFYSDLNENIQMSLQPVDPTSGKIVFDVQTGWTSETGPIPPSGNVTAFYEGDKWLKIGEQEADEDNVTNNNGIGLLAFNAKVFESQNSPEAIIYATDAPYGDVDNHFQGKLQNGKFIVDFKGDRSSDPNNDIKDYLWDFDDDGTIDSYGPNKWWEFTAPGTYNVSLTLVDNAGNRDIARQTVLVFADTSNVCGQHGLNYERFDGITGTTVQSLVDAGVFNSPSSHSYIDNFEIPANIADNYGARVRGYIVPPITGDYEFWVASDDESKVWIHSLVDRDDPAFSVPSIATSLTHTPTVYIEGFSSPELQFIDADSPWNGRQWTAGVEFNAYTIFTKTLEVGKQYYVEALYKEGGSGDHMSLGWKLPGAKSYSLIENENLCVARTDLPLAPLSVIDASTTEGEAPLTVLFDSDSVDSDGTITQTVWSFGDGNINNSNTTATSHQYRTPGTYYTVLSVTDNDNYTNHAVERIEVLEPDCSVNGNGILFERFDNIGGRLVSDMLQDDAYLTGIPSHKARLNAFEMPSDVGDEYAARFRGYIVPDSTGGHTFRIAADDQAVVLLSTDEDPANATPIMAVTNYTGTLTFDSTNGIPGYEGWTPVRDWLNVDTKYTHQQSQMITLTAGQRYYVEVLYKEEFFGDHMSIAWQEPGSISYDLVLCNNLEPFNDATHNLEVTVTPSQITVPSSGAWVEYEVVLTNSSSAELGTDPIQIDNIIDSKHGEIASTAAGWSTPFVENSCWWWIPELWVGQSWRCTYTQWVTGDATAHTLTVNGTTVSGKAISELADIDHQVSVGPGVKNTNAWASDGIEVIQQFTPLVDTDGDMDLAFDVNEADVRDTEGILIGDYDLDGVCDLWQTWWLRNCVALSTSDVMSVLDDDSSADMRVRLLRSLTATWLNIAAGNAYECADMQTVVNLGLIWLNDHGNPLEGGTPIASTNPYWQEIEYAQVWYDWYNDTGGNLCADSVSGGSSTCGTLAQEAEVAASARPAPLTGDFIFGNRIKVVSDASANGGEYIHGRTNASNQWNMRNRWRNGSVQYYSPHRAEFCVNIPADGYYSVDGWVRTPLNGRDNSFFVQFNNGGYALWDTATDSNNFVYSHVSHRPWGSWNKAVWYLPAGEHTLKFHLRENGTQLDRFEVKAYNTRNAPENVLDAGTPLGNDYYNPGSDSGADGHYMYQWLTDGNNVNTGARSGNNHSGEFAAAMAGFLTDVDGATDQENVDVTGAVGYIEGGVDVADGTEDLVHEAGVTNFNPNFVPTSVAVSNTATDASPVVLQLLITIMSTLTLGVLMLRKRKN